MVRVSDTALALSIEMKLLGEEEETAVVSEKLVLLNLYSKETYRKTATIKS
jgi:hypothetical protein